MNDDTVYYDCFDLKIVYERNRTGFEETKDYPIDINGVIAGRYQVRPLLPLPNTRDACGPCRHARDTCECCQRDMRELP